MRTERAGREMFMAAHRGDEPNEEHRLVAQTAPLADDDLSPEEAEMIDAANSRVRQAGLPIGNDPAADDAKRNYQIFIHF
jgi:hypothetical protein